MKKIISMLCVVAMMLSFVAISANASGEKISLVANEAATTEDTLAFDVVVECAEGIKNAMVQLKYADFLSKNAMTDDDFSTVKVSGTGANKVAAQDFITSNYADTNAASTTVTLCTVFVKKENFKNDAAFTLTANAHVNNIKSYTTAGLEVAAPKAPVTVNTVDASKVVAVTNADTINGEATDYQIGAGVAMTVNAGENIFTKMIWAITVGEERRFSPVVELPNLTGEFEVAATFINGSHANEFGKDEVEAVEFDNVGAIFTNGEADFFTNADDAALKAE